MVSFRSLSDAEVDRVFHALSDRTRRDIVTRVMRGEQTVSELAARYEMSFTAVRKHVAVLESAGLVVKHPRGRERIVHGNPERIAKVRDLLVQLEGLWKARFSQLDAVLREPCKPE
jgi:DNA-binding transcriptional ArsR family regulator